jgi:polysaccharide pyruvyl transferase WcaK-like protein
MLKLRLKGHDCYYYLSPGGYFGEINGFEVVRRFINFFVLVLMSLAGIRIVHVGVSYERLGPRFLSLIAWRSRILYRHILRDPKSAIYANQNGIKYHGVSPDLAFNLYSENRVAVKAQKVCFSFRTDQDREQMALVKSLVQTCNETLHSSYEFIFYAQVERDLQPMKELAAFMKQKSCERKISFVSIMGEVDQSVEFFEDVDIIISNRLHVLLMGGVYNASVIAAVYKGYNDKVRGLMESLVADNQSVIDMSLEPYSQISRVTNAEFKFSPSGRNENRSLGSAFSEIYT